MSAIAIIPARGGSRRIPKKNIRLFHDKPIIAYSIETAKRTSIFDHIAVTTDDPEIAEISWSLGAFVVYRVKKLAADGVGTQEVMTNTVGLFDCDLVCCIYATAPLMKATDVVRGYRAITRDGIQYAFAVGRHPLRDAGQFYWAKKEALIERKQLVDEHSAMVPIDEKRVCDINTEEDWKIAEEKYLELACWEREI
jgi:pseudaminic acid cytidylyltransferase